MLGQAGYYAMLEIMSIPEERKSFSPMLSPSTSKESTSKVVAQVALPRKNSLVPTIVPITVAPPRTLAVQEIVKAEPIRQLFGPTISESIKSPIKLLKAEVEAKAKAVQSLLIVDKAYENEPEREEEAKSGSSSSNTAITAEITSLGVNVYSSCYGDTDYLGHNK